MTSTAASGNISTTIPNVSGNGYRIRVISSNPTFTSADNGSNITITPFTNPSYISLLSQACIGGSDWEATFQPYPLVPGVTYLWSENGGPYYVGGSTYGFYHSGDPSVTLNVKYQNACGTSSPLTYPATFYTPCGGYSFSVSPNPARDFLQIELSNLKPMSLLHKPKIQLIEIIDKVGLIVYRNKYGNETKKVTVFIGNLKNDIYTLRIFDGKEWSSSKVSIQH